jgi:3-dehydroquinate synthase
MAASLSVACCGLPADLAQRLDELLSRLGLPEHAPQLEDARWLDLMRGDKKSLAGRVRYVVLPRWGQAALAELDDAAALAAVRAIPVRTDGALRPA